MEFHRFQDAYSIGKKLNLGISVEDYYAQACRTHIERENFFREDMNAELAWWKHRRPYYCVWPAMLEILGGFDITKVPFELFVNAPHPCIVLRFPVGAEPLGMQCILTCPILYKNGICGFHFCAQMSEYKDTPLGREQVTCSSLALTNVQDFRGATIANSWDNKVNGFDGCTKEMQAFALSVLLLEKNDELFEPDILSKLKEKYETGSEEQRMELEEKSFNRRGQVGFHIGRKLESIPHFRRPHPALYWTGKGRKVPKIVLRSGSVVKRKMLTEAPTGFVG